METMTPLVQQLQQQDNVTNIAGIIAGVLGGCLLTLVIGFGLFVVWKRRFKKKKKEAVPDSPANLSTAPVLVPALYDFSTSRRSSFQTHTSANHLYEEIAY